MPEFQDADFLFFFGAGASAPFGIPTMKQFVIDFEREMGIRGPNTSDSAVALSNTYTAIKNALETKLGVGHVDLEAIFSVIDGIINYSPDRLGLLALYLLTKSREPSELDIQVCKLLREKFQSFVRAKCLIPEEENKRDHISRVYHDFFNRLLLEFSGGRDVRDGHYWSDRWAMFTTNYDTCLEYYWRQVTSIGIDTGFDSNPRVARTILNAKKLLSEGSELQLFKLHGSVNWLIEAGTGLIMETEMETARSHYGRRIQGEAMIYPIAEKELYLDPYISMLLRLNRELENKRVWVVIGYSFNDPIIREIFQRKSRAEKKLILVHPEATKVREGRLTPIRSEIEMVEKRFGEEGTFRQVDHQIIHKLKENPKYSWQETPLK
jgi:hypothetical protein